MPESATECHRRPLSVIALGRQSRLVTLTPYLTPSRIARAKKSEPIRSEVEFNERPKWLEQGMPNPLALSRTLLIS